MEWESVFITDRFFGYEELCIARIVGILSFSNSFVIKESRMRIPSGFQFVKWGMEDFKSIGSLKKDHGPLSLE